MIRSIALSDIATFSGQHEMDDLAEINTFFGANGVGKTTISRIIASPDRYPQCAVEWDDDELDTFVYNLDFVDRNFSQSPQLRGVFTLGEEQVETLASIESTKAELATKTKEMRKLTVTLEGEDGTAGLRAQMAGAAKVLADRCWSVKGRHDDAFKSVFQGYRGSRSAFRDKILAERGTAASEEVPDLETLREEVRAAFETAPTQERLLSSPDGAALEAIVTDDLLATRIVGREDVPIGEVIAALGNSDWVRRGRSYLSDDPDQTCPFCQQPLPPGLRGELEEYFDESYSSAMRALNDLAERHARVATEVDHALEELITSPGRFLDKDALSRLAAQIRTIIKINGDRLASKRAEPGAPVELESFSGVLSEVTALVEAANARAAAHNQMVSNLEAERARIRASVWGYLLHVELAEDLKTYDQTCRAHAKGIDSVEAKIDALRKEMREGERRLEELERKVTSTRPTVVAMNRLLGSLGFTSFSIEHAADEKSYRLVRHDGNDASDTLSEGERSFVTFLYFYHLIRGSTSPTGVDSDRIVVFDDPVSSLDSDVLFFVSMLIRGLIDEVRAGTGSIKQVFVLTHNAYFHREVTFDPRRVGFNPRRDESFWVVRKVGAESEVDRQDQNPVRTAYDLLWEELRNPRPGSTTLQNTMRRILENYFKILGGIDPRDVIAEFSGQDQVTCRSLVSWANAGSHFAMDDLYIAVTDNEDLFRKVFREIFEKSGHGGHYQMMMRTDEDPRSEGQSPL